MRLDSVIPTELPIGGFAEGLLEGSEYSVSNDDGSLLHHEKAPSAITYKVSSNWATPARLRHAFNEPELTDDVYTQYDPWLHITSDAFVNTEISNAYMRYIGPISYMGISGPGGAPFYYQSFQNESYYATVIGMENVEYSLFHDQPDLEELPVNQEFYIENNDVETETKSYSLQLSQDSVLRLNSTEGSHGYDWQLWTVDDDWLYHFLEIDDNSAFTDAEIIDSLSPLLKYNIKPVPYSASSRLDHSFEFLEHYESVSLSSLLNVPSRAEKKFVYPLA